MKHIDVTMDLETVATTANAAVMQVAAVTWLRDAESNPFCGNVTGNYDYSFNEYIDLRSCVVDGFDFDQQTVAWWSRQNEAAKRAVCNGLPEPVEEVFCRFIHWLEFVMKDTGAESICLWCQGMDFDASILRNICAKYDLQLPFRHQQFRDCRTIIIEAALARSTDRQDILANPSRAYDLYMPLPDHYAGEVHDALYDAVRSSWNTWQALRMIQQFEGSGKDEGDFTRTH